MTAFLAVMGVGTYLLVGGVITWLAVRHAPNRWVVDWIDYGVRLSRTSNPRVSRVATRWLFWLWPIPAVCMTIGAAVLLILKFFSLSDAVTRLAARDTTAIK